MRRFVSAVVAGLIALGAGAGLAGCGRHGQPANAQAYLALMPGLTAFVEQARGLKFKDPVPVELLSPKAFLARLNDGDPVDPLQSAQDVDDDLTFYRAWGLVHGPVDVSKVAKALDHGTDGFYDPAERKMFIPVSKPTLYNQMVLVHELTHALDDQWFGVDRDLNDQEADAFDALVEGNATAVERRWYDSRTPAEQAAIDAEADRLSRQDGPVPQVFDDDGLFAYRAGRQFADALYAKGGSAAVDAAFGRPPKTAEQVLHLDKYEAGEPAVAVDEPTAGGEVLWDGVLGEGWYRLLAASVLDEAAAERAAAGWGGDSYVFFDTGGKQCIRARLAMDTPADTAEMLAALRTWAAKTPASTVDVERSGSILIASCGDRSANRP